MRQEQQLKQLQMQHEQQQQLKQQQQRQMQEEQQNHEQHMQNEQRQQRRQQLIQHDQQQSQQQQQDALSISLQSSPGHSASSSFFSSSSAPSACSSTISCSLTLSTCSSSSPSDSCDLDRYKTELCRSYEENGTCRYGNKCLFAHGRGQLRLLERHPKYKTEFCRTYHSSGFCPYGQRCHFIHSCQNSPLAVPSPGLAIRPGEGSLIGSIGQLPIVLVATGREWNEAQGKLVGSEGRFSEPEQRFNKEARRFNEPERLRNDIERKLAEMELERNTIEYDRRHQELERKSLEPNWKIIHPERRFVEAERKPLELELSAILQRRRRQLRCGSVGSSCETPPPFMVGLDNFFNPSRTSSPMMLDDPRSPSFAISSPLTTYSNPVDIPHSGAVRYNGPVSRNLKGSPGLPTNNLGLSFTPPKDIGSVQTPPWTLSDALAPRSASRTSSPGLHQFGTMSSAARQQGTFFLFDGDTLAKLIQRS